MAAHIQGPELHCKDPAIASQVGKTPAPECVKSCEAVSGSASQLDFSLGSVPQQSFRDVGPRGSPQLAPYTRTLCQGMPPGDPNWQPASVQFESWGNGATINEMSVLCTHEGHPTVSALQTNPVHSILPVVPYM